METLRCIATKLDVREFSNKTVPDEVKFGVLEAGRLTGSGINKQAWHFVLVSDQSSLSKLAEDCPQGSWLGGADFAVIILTSPRWPFHVLDAGRALQDMQLAAWDYGVASCPTTVFSEETMRIDFNIPMEFAITAVLGFGYPAGKILGKKDRKQLVEIASLDRYGNPLAAGQKLS
jgi:nitroreductase